MTPTRLRECLAALGWSQRGVAKLLGRQEGTVRQWARGAVEIPDDVGAWLDKLARFHERNPAPKRKVKASALAFQAPLDGRPLVSTQPPLIPEPASPVQPTMVNPASSSRHAPPRAPRGTWPKILDASLDILKAEGRPMRTKELISELLKRGFTFEMSSPVTSLSNKLANSLLFRSNRNSGWHLTEWPDMPIDHIREVLTSGSGTTMDAETPATDPRDPRRVVGMSSPVATMEVLRDCRRPMTVYEIARELEERGYQFVSDDHAAAVSTGLTRRLKTKKDVRRESPGKWVLTEWYTAEEIAKMDAKMGGKDGHDIFGNAEKTRQALLKAQANGVRLGRPSKISDREKENARKLIEGGANPRVIADTLQIKRKTVMRWIEKWKAEAQMVGIGK